MTAATVFLNLPEGVQVEQVPGDGPAVVALTGADEALLALAGQIVASVQPEVECPECDGTGYVWSTDRLGEGQRGCRHCKRTGRVTA